MVPHKVQALVEFSLHQIMFIYSLGLAKEHKKTVQTLRPSNAPPPTATQARALSFILRTDLTTMSCLVFEHTQHGPEPSQHPEFSSLPKMCAGEQSTLLQALQRRYENDKL